MSKLRIGVIGAGLWGNNHAHTFNVLPETELVGVCDLDEGRALKMKESFGAIEAFTDYQKLIASDRIDAVSVATPDFTHTPIILAALKAGKHVLSEKPLATTVKEAEEIAEAAAKSKGKLMIDFHNRVNPILAQVRDMIQEGQIGLAKHGTARLSNTTFVPFEMLSWAAKSSALWFLGSHLVDVLRFILEDEVTRVYAVARSGTLAAGGVDTKDFHASILEFSRGTVVTMENSWILSRDNPSLVDFKVEVVGEKGQIQADPTHSGGLRRIVDGGMRFNDYIGMTPTGATRIGGFVQESIARFVDSVVRGVPLLADANDGLANTKVLAAIEESVASGKPVTIG
ncbi:MULTISPECIES: Gfo/Idh/MocA family protein [Rhizobium]|uniref:Dehydrogenase n=3 Tax=Rhizobium TaxID=379 RepID=A0A6P1CHE5_RHITR|nr:MULTISPECIES: Gfo/Idh/MocA family oxidoreductase [Rhizobium]AGB73430.1 sugar dehydrogenase [Rhizobium tropici CIAT 899]AYG70361.1 gfo/Idh/MocA family oxidoreductase [Rhizobium sp. CCGE531]AYG73897.1 gfo/Idh/MocA family oxidoreductase [Rhizobium sp. CCGE532]AYG76761.1 gfo/Idh/MocA family oxidoreductase [Rhizobium sp. CCGE532]ENN88297.1 sugar dehydrogenase [Rhizobium freirei PRF 81]